MLWPDEKITDDTSVNEITKIDFGWQPKRRLPVFLLLDVSASMCGAPIQAVIEGVKLLHTQLLETPTALETVWISIIRFGTEANTIVPLTPIIDFELKDKDLDAGGVTSLGAAFHLLEQALDHDIQAGTDTEKADWRPLVYLLTDGDPTDDWEPVIERLKARTEKKMGTVVALACGNDIDETTLKKITEHVVRMEDVNADYLKSFFKWVSQSVSGASTSAGAADRASQTLPPLPEGLSSVQ
jgi:uncharacterized protein YegL